LAHVLTSPDRVTGFRGLAGSGKSTALVELAHALHKNGFEAVFLRSNRPLPPIRSAGTDLNAR